MLYNPMDYSTLGFPVLHYLWEFAQTHVYWIGDAIQPSHPLSLPSLLAINLFPASGSFPVSQLSSSDGQSIGALAPAVLPKNIQGQFLEDWLVWSPCCPRDSQESSPTSQFKSISSLAWHSAFFIVQCSHPYVTTGKTIALTRWSFILLDIAK